MKKEIRQKVYEKYNGRCAYCGTELGKHWDIDHINPKAIRGTDDEENLNPSCKSCNNYKGAWGLEEFRLHLDKLLNSKPEYLFKSKAKMNVAINMGAITISRWDGKFYFEKVCFSNNSD